ncbi:hypothetical protein F0562_034216 [Nyssa sinensis]|uniref:RGS domain-containing protein n=1 Tax=Nyssa sinensis TaxID=561372 RepID=A0A5J5AHH3_9ASTE|nr:hypothetical protein F0562_034216 [Nyssa sinensis]
MEIDRQSQENTIAVLENDITVLLSACSDATQELEIEVENKLLELSSATEMEKLNCSLFLEGREGGGDAVAEHQQRISSKYFKTAEKLLSTARKAQALTKQFENTRNVSTATIEDLQNKLKEAKITLENAIQERDLNQNRVSELESDAEALQNLCNEMRFRLEDYQAKEDKMKEREEEYSSLYNTLLMKEKETENPLLSASQVKSLFDKINGIEIPFAEFKIEDYELHDSAHVRKLFYIIDTVAAMHYQVNLLSHDKEELQSAVAKQVLEIEQLRKEVEEHSKNKQDCERMTSESFELADEVSARVRLLETPPLPSQSEISEIEDVIPLGKKAISPVPSAAHIKVMYFKSLNTSGLIPRKGKMIADRIDGIWVSGGRALMSRPGARLGLIAYWLFLHIWLFGTILASTYIIQFGRLLLYLANGLVILISLSRYLLLKTWIDFGESSKAANHQVLTSLQPLDYMVVAFLPGVSEQAICLEGPYRSTLKSRQNRLAYTRKFRCFAVSYCDTRKISPPKIPTAMASCDVEGGCPSDYIAISVSLLIIILLLAWSTYPFLVHKVPCPKGSSFWLPAIQVFASFNLLLSIVISVNFLKFRRRHWWQSCYIWAVWVEGPLGFGLLLSCRIVQAVQLYYIFVERRLPPIRSHIFLPIILLPWIGGAAFIHMKKPLNYRCHMGTQWMIPFVCLHALYVAALVGFTGAIRHVEFRFHELKDLWRGILVSASSIGIWIAAFILNEIHEEIAWLQVASRFLLLIMASIFVLAFFSLSSSQPLLSQMSLRKTETREFETMGQALGIPDSGLLLQREAAPVIDPNEPLDKLLLNKRFRQSFMTFADSCLAGESVHFYDEVHELAKIPVDDPVRRIYMARYIIEKYIIAGATMEVNISHRSRQEILTTLDLAHPDLFKNALNELVQLMKMNLGKDYWSSMFFLKFKEEASMRTIGHELEHMNGWNFSPRLSSVHGADDPFHQEHPSKEFGHDSHDSNLH